MPDRGQLIEIFADTRHFYESNEILREAVRVSTMNTKYYPADFNVDTNKQKSGKLRIIMGRTVKTAFNLSREFPDKKIAILNFASSTEPGGGVLSGSRAQEESICRSTTLYPSLNTDEIVRAYYFPHREDYSFKGWDECIYSPNVIICRDDNDELPPRLSPEEFAVIDVITCAAPHLTNYSAMKSEELLSLHVKRAKNILRVCAYNDVDIFVGGAFGCGAFHNDPYIVAWAWREVLKEFQNKFDMTVFAVYAQPGREGDNYRAFRNEFSDACNEADIISQEKNSEEE